MLLDELDRIVEMCKMWVLLCEVRLRPLILSMQVALMCEVWPLEGRSYRGGSFLDLLVEEEGCL